MSTSRALTYWWDHGPMRRVIRRGRWEVRQIEPADVETAADMERYMQSASTPARERVALMRMAWDFLGTEFGNRHAQYEKFYGGASFLVKQNVNRFYDYKSATALVDKALALPPVTGG